MPMLQYFTMQHIFDYGYDCGKRLSCVAFIQTRHHTESKLSHTEVFICTNRALICKQ